VSNAVKEILAIRASGIILPNNHPRAVHDRMDSAYVVGDTLGPGIPASLEKTVEPVSVASPADTKGDKCWSRSWPSQDYYRSRSRFRRNRRWLYQGSG